MTKKILVAVDETEASRRAVEFVEEFFMGADVSLTVVNVARSPVSWVPASPYGGVAAWPYPMGDVRREEIDPALDEAYAREEAAGRSVASQQAPPGADIEVTFGETVDAISVAAEEVDADLIVVGSTDKGFLQRLFSGSVSEELVRKAPRPVLVVS